MDIEALRQGRPRRGRDTGTEEAAAPGAGELAVPRQASNSRVTRSHRGSLPITQHTAVSTSTARADIAMRAGTPRRANSATGTASAATLPARRSTAITAPPVLAAGPAAPPAGAAPTAPAGRRRRPACRRSTRRPHWAPAGNDLSYPQCGTVFPSSPAFGIVGVTGGLANDLNPCLGPASSYLSSELYWAAAAPAGGTSQPKASLYVNTADPGNVYNGTPIADWPATGTTPYGACTTTTVTTSTGPRTVGQNSPACAWQYGYNKAVQDVSWVSSAASAIDAQSPPVQVSGSAGAYPWWLDVETVNTWQSGTAGQAMNVADLQGMIAALQQAGASPVGAYSTSSQWNKITGGTTSSSGSLSGIPDWVPGARTLSGAKSNCGLASFTAGRIAVTQWSGHPDNDYAC